MTDRRRTTEEERTYLKAITLREQDCVQPNGGLTEVGMCKVLLAERDDLAAEVAEGRGILSGVLQEKQILVKWVEERAAERTDLVAVEERWRESARFLAAEVERLRKERDEARENTILAQEAFRRYGVHGDWCAVSEAMRLTQLKGSVVGELPACACEFSEYQKKVEAIR